MHIANEHVCEVYILESRIHTRDHWVLGFRSSSGIIKSNKNIKFPNLDLFPFSGEGWETGVAIVVSQGRI
jgi:hypothetical protein